MSKNIHERNLRCTICRRPALFITPLGLMCRQHALTETINRQADSEKWTPVLVKQPDSAPIRPKGADPDLVTVSA